MHIDRTRIKRAITTLRGPDYTDATNQSLYDQVVAIAADYLGIAGQRFIDRQIQSLLKKEPNNLNVSDLKTIIDWSRIALTVVTDKRQVVAEFVTRLEHLQKEYE